MQLHWPLVWEYTYIIWIGGIWAVWLQFWSQISHATILPHQILSHRRTGWGIWHQVGSESLTSDSASNLSYRRAGVDVKSLTLLSPSNLSHRRVEVKWSGVISHQGGVHYPHTAHQTPSHKPIGPPAPGPRRPLTNPYIFSIINF